MDGGEGASTQASERSRGLAALVTALRDMAGRNGDRLVGRLLAVAVADGEAKGA